MTLFKRLLKTALFGVTGLVTLVFLAVLTINLWLRAPVVELALPFVTKALDIELQPQELQIRARHESARVIGLELSAKHLSFAKVAGLSGEIDGLKVKISFEWLSVSPHLTEVTELRLDASEIAQEPAISQSPSTTEKSAIPDLRLAQFIPSFLTEVRFGAIQARVKGLPEKNDTISMQASSDSSALGLSLIRANRTDFVSLKLPLSAERKLELLRTHGEALLHLGEIGLLQGVIDSRKCSEKIANDSECLRANVTWTALKKGGLQANAVLESVLKKSGLFVSVDGAVLRAHPWMPKLQMHEPCTLDLSSPEASKMGIKFKCSAIANLAIPPVPQVPRLQRPSKTGFTVDLAAELDRKNGQTKYDGKLSLYSDPVLAHFLKAQLKLKSDFKGILEAGLSRLQHTTSLSISAKVPKIEEPIALLHETAWAVPAPLNNLRGPVAFELKSQWKNWESRIPFQLTTSLGSVEQSFKTRLDGTADVKLATNPGKNSRSSVHVTADWLIEDLRLSAPRLSVQSIPRFFPDSNIRVSAVKKHVERPSLLFTYDINARTKAGAPLKIDSNLVKTPVLIDASARLKSNGEPLYSVGVHPFEFEAFNRKATMKEFKLTRTNPEEPGDVDGKVEALAGDAKVFAHLYGRVDRVKVELNSDPPVPQDELWALLLYGEPLDQLDIDQQDTSQSASRALSKGALGLFSLYAFSSTPVERIDYDPATQNVSVRFKIKEGTSLVVGRSEDETASLGLRKKIGKGWTLNAKVSENRDEATGQGQDKTEAGATLEWAKRY